MRHLLENAPYTNRPGNINRIVPILAISIILSKFSAIETTMRKYA